MASDYDRQKDIEAEGQRAAIFHARREKGGHNKSFQIAERPAAPTPTRRRKEGLVVSIGGGEIVSLMARISAQVSVLADADRHEFMARFEAMKAYDVDMITMEWRDGVLTSVPTDEFLQHLKAYGINV